MTDEERDDIDDALEWKLRAIAVPVTFVLALAFHASPTGLPIRRRSTSSCAGRV